MAKKLLRRPRGKRRRHERDPAAASDEPTLSSSTIPPQAKAEPVRTTISHPAKRLRDGDSHTSGAKVWPSAGQLPSPMSMSSLSAAMKMASRESLPGDPTEIQRRAWPCILSGKDTVGIAPTGSGKTLAFVLPMAELLARPSPTPRPPRSPLILVVAPTRELALQIKTVCAGTLGASGHSVVSLHGGEPRSVQRAMLWKAGAIDVVVGTPGRLVDLAGGEAAAARDAASTSIEPSIRLDRVALVVLDEADKLLASSDLREQVRALHAQTAATRQTCLFTATFAHGLPELASGIVQEAPCVVHVHAETHRGGAKTAGRGGEGDESGGDGRHGGERERGNGGDGGGGDGDDDNDDDDDDDEGDGIRVRAPSSDAAIPSVPLCIRQEVSVCAEHKKPRRLLKLLDQLLKGGGGAATAASGAADASDAGAMGAAGANPSRRDRRVLIFANKIKAVSFVAQLLQRHGVRASTLSSRLAQHEREATLRRFIDGHVPVLVATDVAARGVHIDGLRYVINWDFGSNLEQYVHRIGRTGRQGEAGTAYSFFSRALRPLAPAAVALLRAHHQSVDQYLDALAREVSGEAARGAEADLPPAPAADEDEDEDEDEGGGGAKVSAMGGDDSASSDDDDDDERGRGSAQRWLAARLKSPITGVSASFATSSARATGASAATADSDDDSE